VVIKYSSGCGCVVVVQSRGFGEWVGVSLTQTALSQSAFPLLSHPLHKVPASTTNPQNKEREMAHQPPVVIDNGTGYTKMGYACNSDPQFIIPTAIASKNVQMGGAKRGKK